MNKLPKKTIPGTGLVVSVLGLGTVKLGRDKGVKYPEAFTIPDDQAALALLQQAWDLGINLIDTAPAYGSSEQRLGELLPQLPHDWIICSKAGELFNSNTGESSFDFSADGLKRSVENSLKRLNRDQIEIVLIHSDGNDVPVIEHYKALETLNKLKQQGLILAAGMSTKTVEGGLLTLDQADIAMVTHNLAYQDEQAVLDAAANKNKSVFIKKAFASGHLPANTTKDSVTASFEMIFANPAVASVVVGTINPVHLADNVAKAIVAFDK
ncbi:MULTISPECIES: aldo/keto reductase [unclassified Methylophaga]|jgi:aryl-alcohol dehydrogenase-like predicted oxidoreductase|uniref:aldo/keto reductase n=2 Tax=Methylophaga TaxID=40222 RepID=UPI000C52E663|nr:MULTISPECIES: aldo/keto reductase [unclassified Methylophaga]MAL50184.1 aldo/keto reductase [Methylophaga sp.]MAM28232.1 aldo/keto reductase [Flavobacteriaceae bacterium]MBP23952.1 aldo/keto reductase [Methylophaga sp.]HCC80273.1 aldo/keto reductase [Methylophaga sp.]|tara:strand:- start:2399 stop:3202 length:804 start_codon:yes stop_codon:yes gene_type:complete